MLVMKLIIWRKVWYSGYCGLGVLCLSRLRMCWFLNDGVCLLYCFSVVL